MPTRADKIAASLRFEKQKADSLNDVQLLYGKMLGLKTAQDERAKAWVDPRPLSAYQRCIQFFRGSWEAMRASHGNIFIYMWLAPRHGGKSVICQAETTRLIPANRDVNILYGSETEKQANHRVQWVQGRLKRPAFKRLYGSFQSAAWSKNEFWVPRPAGEGENPTMFATAPGKASTGYHWDVAMLDDVVGKQSNYTPLTRATVIAWFREIVVQRSPNSVIWIIGTMWEGFQLYRHIMAEEELAAHANIVIVPAHGPATDHKGNELFGEHDVYNYPWIDAQFLQAQRETLKDDRFWLAQYFNKIVDSKALSFELSMLKQSEPPMKDGKLDRSKVRLYVLTDTASTTKPTRHSSKSVIAVICKDEKNHLWVLDFAYGAMAPDTYVDRFLDMWLKWRPWHYVMETTGPGAERRFLIQRMAMAREIPVPPIREASRWGTTKDSRIQMIFPSMHAGDFSFAPTLPYAAFRVSNTGLPDGLIPHAFLRYDPTSIRQDRDILDCFADGVLCDRDGNMYCPPMPKVRTRAEEKQENRIQQAFRELGVQQAGPGVKFL